eukprot:scpid27046/ scgid22821/ 
MHRRFLYHESAGCYLCVCVCAWVCVCLFCPTGRRPVLLAIVTNLSLSWLPPPPAAYLQHHRTYYCCCFDHRGDGGRTAMMNTQLWFVGVARSRIWLHNVIRNWL